MSDMNSMYVIVVNYSLTCKWDDFWMTIAI